MKDKNQRGITLIALVITIIVLIILAGICINLLFGKNGIISNAKSVGEVSEKANIDEKLKLAYSSVVIDKYTEGITDLSSSNPRKRNIYNWRMWKSRRGSSSRIL